MNLEPRLRRMIPQVVDSFRKLAGGSSPYRFAGWGQDGSGRSFLRYSFPSRNGEVVHRKRVWVREIEAALRTLANQGTLSRDQFCARCPRTASDGPCGFTVVGRILEQLGVAAYQGRGEGFRCTNISRARELQD